MLSQLAADIRFMQFYAHAMHNLCKGPTFFQDHEFLGELYPVYEENQKLTRVQRDWSSI